MLGIDSQVLRRWSLVSEGEIKRFFCCCGKQALHNKRQRDSAISPVLHRGRVHHCAGRWISSHPPKTQGDLHRHCVHRVLYYWTLQHHTGEDPFCYWILCLHPLRLNLFLFSPYQITSCHHFLGVCLDCVTFAQDNNALYRCKSVPRDTGQPRGSSTNLQCYNARTHRRSNCVSSSKVVLSVRQQLSDHVPVCKREATSKSQSGLLIHLQVAESRTIDGWWRDGWLVLVEESEVTLVLTQSSLDNQMDKYNLTHSLLMFLETCNKQV